MHDAPIGENRMAKFAAVCELSRRQTNRHTENAKSYILSLSLGSRLNK